MSTSNRVMWGSIRWPGVPMMQGPMVGIEIETESTTPYDVATVLRKVPSLHVWRAEQDGSLRNFGMEYISVPLDYKAAKESVKVLLDTLHDSAPSLMHWCPRAGVHVHMNVRDLTNSEIWTAACIYWTIEHHLTNWCGDSRVGNNFCLRLKDATRLVGSAISAVQSVARVSSPSSPEWRLFTPASHKYAGLNLATVQTLGTLEFRALDGTTDHVRINHWIDQVIRVRELAMEFGNPHAFFEWLDKQEDPKALAAKLLTPFMISTIQNLDVWYKQILLDIPLPLSVAYACSNWKRYEEKMFRITGTGDYVQDSISRINAVAARYMPSVTIAPNNPTPTSIYNTESTFLDMDDLE